MDELIGEFLIESYEGLDRLDQHLVVLEESPDDIATLKEVFRTLHTIKGTCGFLGFGHLERVAHAGENLLSLLRDGELRITPEITDALLATVDAIREILATIEQTEQEGEPDNAALIERLSMLADPGTTEGDSAGESVGDSAGDSDGGAALDDPDTGLFLFDPPPEVAPRIGDRLVDAGAADRTDVEIAAAEQQFGDDRQLGEILVDQGRADSAEVESAVTPRAAATEGTIRVDVALLDRLMNLVGELVLSRNQIIQLAGQRDDDLGPPAQRLNLITSELQEGVMKTRMQPINNVWGKLPRVVRDLSNQLGKRVRLEMVGRETELDRTIIEAIKDPLTHIVRNTVDHGIETPEERTAAGKDPEGQLLLRASHEGGQVNIEISDDGKGISPDPIRRKAVEGGFLSAADAAEMGDNEIVQMIFRPGFSTAGVVSNVSGRGVGMDVVKTNVEKIGGTVDLKTVPGEGTTFKIKIPLTLAIIPALTVGCAGNRYAIPQISLLELVRLEQDGRSGRIEDLHGAPVYRLRGKLLPIVELRTVLGAQPASGDITNIVVLTADDRPFGLVVDTIEDTEEIVVKPLGRQVQDLKLFSGATIMGDGKIALILDLLGLAGTAGLLDKDSPAVEAISESNEAGSLAEVLDDRTLLLLGLGASQRVAIPLAAVERLEEFSIQDVEQSEGRPVVQYGTKIMPLVDLAPVLGYEGTAFGGSDRINVVVCSFSGRTVGLAVHEVVDIASHAEVFETINDESASVVIQDHVTDVIDAAAVVRSVLPIGDDVHYETDADGERTDASLADAATGPEQ